MGGHGGLNILPGKSWNVYSRRNRDRVRSDEQKRDERELQNQRNSVRTEQEHRYYNLRSKQNNTSRKEKIAKSDNCHINLFETEDDTVTQKNPFSTRCSRQKDQKNSKREKINDFCIYDDPLVNMNIELDMMRKERKRKHVPKSDTNKHEQNSSLSRKKKSKNH